MLLMKEHVRKIASDIGTVIIYGESGTGKELIANALHGSRAGNFVVVNCASIPETLIESELFGSTKGAFTGANTDRAGLVELAKDGTLFLDEIGELPYLMQAKLLRVVQENKVRRLGSPEERPINCRFVCATHRNISGMVKTMKFRDDLFWRLTTFEINLVPLRQRTKDIPLLLEHFDVTNAIKDKPFFTSKINTETMLGGNVRSIQTMIKRYVVLGIYPGEK